MDVTGITTYEMPAYSTPTAQPAPSASSPAAPSPSAPMPSPATESQSFNNKTAASSSNMTQTDRTEKTERQPSSSQQMDALEKAIAEVNKSISTFNREMHISMHEKTRRIMVKVMDTEENKVIREIPPEKVLDAFARTLELAGILVDKKS